MRTYGMDNVPGAPGNLHGAKNTFTSPGNLEGGLRLVEKDGRVTEISPETVRMLYAQLGLEPPAIKASSNYQEDQLPGGFQRKTLF